MIREDEVYKIGMLTKTHGVSGELNMAFTDDVFDRVEAEYVVNNDNQLYGVVAAIHLSELYKVLNCRNAFL